MMRRGLVLAFFLGLLPAASQAAIFVNQTSPSLVPTPLSRAASETTIFSFEVIANAGGDTLVGCTVAFTTPYLPDTDVAAVRLYIDGDRNARFDIASDTLVGILNGLGSGQFGNGALSYFMPTGRDSFVATLDLADTAFLGSEFQSQIPGNGVACAVDGTGPGGPSTLTGNWTVQAPDTSGPNAWYVNDTSLAGDSFTTAVGYDPNDGLSAGSPKRTLNSLEGFLTPGDTVYIDAGNYLEPDTFTILVNGVTLIGKDSTATVVGFGDSTLASARAIYATGRSNLEIRDLRVTGARNGIWWANVDSSTILRVRAVGQGASGIYLDGGSDVNTVSTSDASNNALYGFHLLTSKLNTLSQNKVAGSGNSGFYLDAGSDTNTLSSNVASNNASNGIYLNSSNGNTLSSNTASNNTVRGIELNASSNNSVLSNTAGGNVQHGINLGASSSNNTVQGNTLTTNLNQGIQLTSSNNNTISSNNSTGDTYGVALNGSSNNTITSNILTGNTSGGVHLDNQSNNNVIESNTAMNGAYIGFTIKASSGNQVLRNIARNNADDGFFVNDDGTNGAHNNSFVQNTADSNGFYAFEILLNTVASTADTFHKNVILTPVARPDSGVISDVANVFDFTRNAWLRGGTLTTDSALIKGMIQGAARDSIVYTPFRLGRPDTAPNADTVAPKAPDTVAGTALSPTAIKITWSSVTANEEDAATTNLSAFRVYRSTTANTADWGSPVATTSVSDSYTDGGLAPGTTYYYRVTSLDNATPLVNESFYSDSIIGVATLAAPIIDIISPAVTADTFERNGPLDEILAVSIRPASGDTIGIVRMRLPSLPPADVQALAFYRDGNKDGDFQAAQDTSLGNFGFISGDTWVTGALAAPLIAPDSFLVVMDLWDTAPTTDTFSVVLPSFGFDFTTAGSGASPSLPLVQSGFWVIGVAPNTAAAYFAVTPAKTISPVATAETHVTTLVVTANGADTMTAVRLRFVGPLNSPAHFDTVAFYSDNDKNSIFDTAVDSFEGNMIYDTATGHWVISPISHPISGVGDSAWHLVTVFLDDTVPSNDTFMIELPTGGVTMASAGTIPLSPILDTTIHTALLPVDSAPPAPFALTFPTAGYETGLTSIPFAWTASSDSSPPISYRLIVDTDFAGAFVVDSTMPGTSATFPIPGSDTYLWRVIAQDAAGNTRAVGDSSFVVDTLPPSLAPLVAPLNGDTRFSPVLLDWSAAGDSHSGILGYRYQVSTSPIFASFVFDLFQIAPDSTVVLSPDTYFWRVVSQDDVGNTTVSVSDTFFVLVPTETSPPSQVRLLTPAQNLDTMGPTVVFTWTAASDSSTPITYVLRRASDSSFSAPLDTNAGTATSFPLTFTGNETVYWRVIATDAVGNTSTAVADSFLRVDVTPPTSTTIEWPAPNHETTATMVGYQWTGVTDGFTGLSHYRLQISDSTSFGTLFVDTNVGTNTTAIVATPGDTKYWRVVPFDFAGNSNPSASFKILVDTTPPSAAALVDPNGGETKTSPVAFDWTNSADSGSGFFRYRIQIANNPSFASPFIDSQPTTADDTFALSNDTWYWRVYAIDDLGNSVVSSPAVESFVVPAPDTTGPTPFTLLSPAHLAETNVASLVFSWSAAADSTGPVTYTLRKATDAGFLTGVDSAVGTATSAVVNYGGDDTTYWRIIASDALGNTRTVGDSLVFVDRTAPVAFSNSFPLTAHETSTTAIGYSWGASSDVFSGLNRYHLQISPSAAFATFDVDSNVGLATSAIFSTLADTRYWRVVAYDDAGNTVASTSHSILVDTVAPTTPGLVDPTAGESVVSPVTLDWNASTDAGVGVFRYRAQIDTSGTFGGPFVLNGTQAAPDTTIALAAGTYYWRIQAEDDFFNQATSVVESFVVFVPSETIPPAAFTLSSPANATATNTTAVTFTWSASSDSSTPITYRLLVDTDLVSPFTIDTTTTATSAAVGIGAGSASYLWRVIAQDAAGNTTLATNANFTIVIDQVQPTAATPSSPVNGSSQSLTSITYSWTAGSDALSGVAGYRLQIDTGNAFTSPLYNQITYGTTASTTPVFVHSLAPATYYWRVFTIDAAGNQAASAPFDSFTRPAPADTTPPVGVGNLTATANNNATITVAWAESPSSDMASGGQYNLYWDNGTGTVSNTSPLSVIAHNGSPTYSFTTGALVNGTLYRFNVRAQDATGNENLDQTVASAYATSGAPPVPQATLFAPEAGARVLRADAMFIAASVLPATDFSRVANVRFQYRLDTSVAGAPWTDMAIDTITAADTNPTSDTSQGIFAVYWDLSGSGIAVGNYQARGVATTGGVSDSTPPIVSFAIVNDTPTRIDTVTAEGIVMVQEEVYGGRADTVVASSDTSFVQVVFQDGSITTETTQLSITLRSCNDTTQGRPNGQPGASARVDLTLTSGQTSFGTKFVIVTLSYPDTDQDGFVDGTTINENEIELWAYTGTTWEQIANPTRDPVKNIVTGQTSHFSTFLLLGPGGSANMADVNVAPNPFRPNNADASDGTPFTGAASGGIVFFNCPAQARIEIYTITGRLVTSFMTTGAVGQNIRWDVKNSDRADVASGYYIWMVTNLSTGERRTGKLAVIR